MAENGGPAPLEREWQYVATSLTSTEQRLLDTTISRPLLLPPALFHRLQRRQELLERERVRLAHIMDGVPRKQGIRQMSREEKIKRLQRMYGIAEGTARPQSAPSQTSGFTPASTFTMNWAIGQIEPPMDGEAEDLILWSQQLDASRLAASPDPFRDRVSSGSSRVSSPLGWTRSSPTPRMGLER